MRGCGSAGRGLLARGPFFPAVLQDVSDGLVSQEVVAQRQCAGALEALLAVVFFQARDAEDGAIGLARMSSLQEHGLRQRIRRRPDLLRPDYNPLRIPFDVLPMALRHMVRLRRIPPLAYEAPVAGHTVHSQEDLHQLLADLDGQDAASMGVGAL
jgi:hypothetical protein